MTQTGTKLDWQFMGNAVCVDRRMAEGLLNGMLEHGLEVR